MFLTKSLMYKLSRLYNENYLVSEWSSSFTLNVKVSGISHFFPQSDSRHGTSGTLEPV